MSFCRISHDSGWRRLRNTFSSRRCIRTGAPVSSRIRRLPMLSLRGQGFIFSGKNLAIFLMVTARLHCGDLLPGAGWVWQDPLPQGNSLASIAVLDAATAIVVGSNGSILRTADGG